MPVHPSLCVGSAVVELVDSSVLTQRFLGSTGLRVTLICLGCSVLGNMPETFGYAVAETQALAILRTAFRSPINFLDTAAAYGDGESERRIGLVLSELGGLPSSYVLATKADRDLRTGNFSGDQIKRSVERSLRLLGLHKLQIVYLHDPEYTTFEQVMAPRGPLAVLRQFQEEGVIDHLGVAGGPIPLMTQYVDAGEFEAAITHNRYTLLNRTAEPLIDLAVRRGVAILNGAPYGSGILAKGPEAYPRYAYSAAPDDVVQRARGAAETCRQIGVPLAAAALQFSLRDPRIASTIVGVSRPERIAETLALASHPIPEGLWAQLEQFAVWEGDPQDTRWARGSG